MSTDVEKPKFPVRELIQAGPNAAKVLVRHTIETTGREIHAQAVAHRARPGFDVEAHVDRLIKSQLRLARAQGAGAGAVVTATELSALVTGPAAVGALGTVVLGDMAILASLQVRLSLMIAAAYGHSMDDIDARLGEILSLHSLEFATSRAAAPAAAQAGQRVGRRLLERYLRGNLLQALKSVFRLVGIKFSRAAMVRGLPYLNIPANATVADLTTRRTAAKARSYYRTLPVWADAEHITTGVAE